MTQATRSTLLTGAADAAIMFPTLTAAQIARLASHGVARRITQGEVLVEHGQTDVPFFVVKAGEIEIVRPSGPGDLVVAVNRPGQFTGEASMLLDRRALMRVRVSESGEVVQLTRGQMHALIQNDAEIGELLMKALIYRRLELVARGLATSCSSAPPAPRRRFGSRTSSRATATRSSIWISTATSGRGTCSIGFKRHRPSCPWWSVRARWS